MRALAVGLAGGRLSVAAPVGKFGGFFVSKGATGELPNEQFVFINDWGKPAEEISGQPAAAPDMARVASVRKPAPGGSQGCLTRVWRDKSCLHNALAQSFDARGWVHKGAQIASCFKTHPITSGPC